MLERACDASLGVGFGVRAFVESTNGGASSRRPCSMGETLATNTVIFGVGKGKDDRLPDKDQICVNHVYSL